MKSSFVRKIPSQSADPGTRPGLHGQTLISLGLVDLDRIVGGGFPLGCLLLVLEDAHSMQHLNLLKYFMAEGMACGQRVMWLAPTPARGGPGQFLPAQAVPSSSSTQAEDDKEGEEEGSGLRIAWQYRKYMGQQGGPGSSSVGSGTFGSSSGSSIGASSSAGSSGQRQHKPGSGSSGNKAVDAGIRREWCHAFDLTKPVGEEAVAKSGLAMQACSMADLTPHAAAFVTSFPTPAEQQQQQQQQQAATSATGRQVAGAVSSSAPATAPRVQPPPLGAPLGPKGVGRIAIQSLGGLAWGAGCSGSSSSSGGSSSATAVLQALLQLKLQLQDRPCAAMVTCPAGLFSESDQLRLQHLADGVLRLDCLEDSSDVFRLLPDSLSACALLSVRKLPSLGMVGPRRVDGVLHVVRNKRRRLTITAVEVDPDAEERIQRSRQQQSGSGSAAGAGSKPAAAGLLCGGPVGAPKALDF